VSLWGLVLTVAVTLAVVVFILVFERRRAREIERDLRGARDDRRRPTDDTPHGG
jgi:hypothetical protein